MPDSRSPRYDTEDWLGGDDWVEEGLALPPRPPRPRPTRGDDDLTVADVSPEEHAHDVAIRRRRLIGLLVGFAVLAALVWLAVTAFGGGSSGDTTTDLPVTTPTTVEQQAPTTATTTPGATTGQTTQTTPTTSPTTPTTTTATPGLTVELAAGEKLQRGSAGTSVTQLQQALIALGFDPGTADGDYGASTEAAVVAFQTANGLTADGVVGASTAQAINTALAGAPSTG